MSDSLQLVAGSEVRCTDGRVGHVGGLIFDPQARTVTHVSVDTHSPSRPGRLVALGVVRSAGAVVQLACAREDYFTFVENEAFVASGVPGRPGAILHLRLVPHGETELKRDETVHALDGRAGPLVGAAVDPESHAVRELLVAVGHFSGRHQIALPLDIVTSIDERGVHVGLSKDELASRVD